MISGKEALGPDAYWTRTRISGTRKVTGTSVIRNVPFSFLNSRFNNLYMDAPSCKFYEVILERSLNKLAFLYVNIVFNQQFCNFSAIITFCNSQYDQIPVDGNIRLVHQSFYKSGCLYSVANPILDGMSAFFEKNFPAALFKQFPIVEDTYTADHFLYLCQYVGGYEYGFALF